MEETKEKEKTGVFVGLSSLFEHLIKRSHLNRDMKGITEQSCTYSRILKRED